MAMNPGLRAHRDPADDGTQRFVSQPVRPRSHGGPRHAAEDRPARGAAQAPLPRAASMRPGAAALARRSWGPNNAWPLLADDLFRVAHDDSGRPLLHRDVAKRGLSAAVLAELLLAGYATIHHGTLMPIRADDPFDAIAAAVMRQLRAEREELAVRDWLMFLATVELAGRDMYDQVGHRLERGRHVEREAPGLLGRAVLRRPVRYVPLDVNKAAWPWARLSRELREGEQLGLFDTALGGLVLATGLQRVVLVGDASGIETALRHNVAAAAKEVRELVYQTETAVGATVITGT